VRRKVSHKGILKNVRACFAVTSRGSRTVIRSRPSTAVETLEKMARALELQLYQLMYDGNKPPEAPTALSSNDDRQRVQGLRGKEGRYFRKLTRLLARMNPDDRNLLLYVAKKMAHGKG
jgi:hypothetical protein